MITRLALCPLLALSLAACAADVEPKTPPLNPAPREAYRVEVWVEDPPRPMRLESMKATFQDMQSGCLPRKTLSGALAASDISQHPLEFDGIAEGRYRSTVHADLLLQTDLYGNGPCDWQLIGVEMRWSDDAMRYRQFAAVRPINGESLPIAEYAVFSRASRGLRNDSEGRSVALPLVSGKGHGTWPSGGHEDLNRRRIDASTGAIEALGPYRSVSPQTDFRVFSRSDRADDY
jgi:hypothetical protein